MVDIAKRYDGRHKDLYIRAALQFRLPFWDYFRPRGGSVKFPGVIEERSTTFIYDYSVPRIFTEKIVNVRRPPGNQLEPLTRNPFNTFDLQRSNIVPPKDWDQYRDDVSATVLVGQ